MKRTTAEGVAAKTTAAKRSSAKRAPKKQSAKEAPPRSAGRRSAGAASCRTAGGTFHPSRVPARIRFVAAASKLEEEAKMALNDREREVVKALTETKAVDFEAIGRALAQFGPTAALDLDYEPIFCGTMRYFIHVYRVFTPQLPGSVGEIIVEE
jgi:hypothetical protein